MTAEARLTNAASRFLHESMVFTRETGLAPSKANELLSAIIVNRWLKSKNYEWWIKLSSRPTGIDGEIKGKFAGPSGVEFKSSGTRSGSYQFDPKFEYTTHGCLVFTEFREGAPVKLFIAMGPQSIKKIESMALIDQTRKNFGTKKADMALVHTTAKPKSTQRPTTVKGLADHLGAGGRSDQIVEIKGPELETLLAEMSMHHGG